VTCLGIACRSTVDEATSKKIGDAMMAKGARFLEVGGGFVLFVRLTLGVQVEKKDDCCLLMDAKMTSGWVG